MVKKLVIIIGTISTSVLLQSMDLKLNNLKRTGTSNSKPTDSREQGEADNKRDFTLNFGEGVEPISYSHNGKRSVKSLNHISHLKSTQNTFRDVSTGRGSSNEMPKEKKRLLDEKDDKEVIEDDNNLRASRREDNIIINNKDDGGLIERPISLPKKRRSAFGDSIQDKAYSVEDMWELMKALTPDLYEHAQDNQLSLMEAMKYANSFNSIDSNVRDALNVLSKKRGLSLEQRMEYAHLLEEFDIAPEAIVSLLKKNHEYSDTEAKLLTDKFNSMKKKDPDNYIKLALDFITRTCDDAGLKEPSPIHSAQVSIQSDTISEQKQQMRYQYVALIVGALITLGGYAWGIFGQVYNPTSPINSPTSHPTYQPTFSPTGSPT